MSDRENAATTGGAISRGAEASEAFANGLRDLVNAIPAMSDPCVFHLVLPDGRPGACADLGRTEVNLQLALAMCRAARVQLQQRHAKLMEKSRKGTGVM